MTADEYNQIELLKDSLLRAFLDQVKSGTSWKKLDAFKFEGFYGEYAFLRKYYDYQDGTLDLIDAIKNLWDIIE